MRFRTHFNIWTPLVILATMFALDPDSGLSIKVFSPGTTVMLLKYLSGCLLISGSFWTVKILLDYPQADTQSLFGQARDGNVGAGLALVARMIMFAVVVYAFASSAHAAPDVRTYIPAQAYTYAPILKAEQMRFWAQHPAPEMLAGLVEQESCLSLTHSRCWNPSSSLKTKREEGAGLGQITKAYRSDGSVRFDALSEMRSAHRELAGLTWDNVYQRPDLQLRAIVLKTQDDYKALSMVADPRQRLDFADASYNGGRLGVMDERRACGLKAGCDPQIWFGHVELTCLKSKAPLYGRDACQINREHVQMVIRVRSLKYRSLMA